MPVKGETVEMDFADPEDSIIAQPSPADAERKLWFAVLEQAFRDVTAPDGKDDYPAMWRGEARIWFASNITTVGSLRWIVHMTGLKTTVAALRERVVQGGRIGRGRGQHRTI